MDGKYIIEGKTLTDIADSLRTMAGGSDLIPVEEYATRIIDLETVSTEEYLLLSNYVVNYPQYLDENPVTPEEITEFDTLLAQYNLEGVELNA